MGARRSAQFLEGLSHTKRELWVDGEQVLDVPAHPKLAGATQTQIRVLRGLEETI